MNRQCPGNVDDRAYAYQIAYRADRKFRKQSRIDRHGAHVTKQNRVTVGNCSRSKLDTDIARRARAVVDDDRLTQLFTELWLQNTRNKIRRAAGREWHDHAHRLRRISLSGG